MTALIISNKEMEYIMKIVKSLKESGLQIKGVSKTITNEAKELKGRFFGMLLGTLATSIFENRLAGKSQIPGRGVIRAGKRAIKGGERTIRACHDF